MCEEQNDNINKRMKELNERENKLDEQTENNRKIIEMFKSNVQNLVI